MFVCLCWLVQRLPPTSCGDGCCCNNIVGGTKWRRLGARNLGIGRCLVAGAALPFGFRWGWPRHSETRNSARRGRRGGLIWPDLVDFAPVQTITNRLWQNRGRGSTCVHGDIRHRFQIHNERVNNKTTNNPCRRQPMMIARRILFLSLRTS